ncbi:MAG: dTMP kinase [Alistipes sp.]|nr:dTMP kinase [Alistipes sp.]MBQ8553242.1 dTMP kinase [Alistipes sp.]
MFIVLEGVDGSGKSTQIANLQRLFAEQGIPTEYLHFPRFDAPYFGDLIARFLRGELGSVEQVDPYIVAMLYAGDRRDAAEMIRGWIAEGRVVICDRYVYSNIGYQCAKVAEKEERERLREWILSLEYDYFKIPRPDVSLFLDVPFAFTERKLLQEQREGDDRAYLHGKKDIHEQSMDLQRQVRQVYIDAAQYDEAMHVVDCSHEGEMASPEEIFGRIKAVVEKYIKVGE